MKAIDSTVLKKGTDPETVCEVAIASEFIGPSAQELICLLQTNPGKRHSEIVEEESFASLLNRGSCEE